MQAEVVEFESTKSGESVQAVYEHPWVVRFTHWVNAVALFVMVGSGLQIFRAFPSFGAKIPEKDLLNWPKAFAIGGWLGGGLQWHLTFMWIYIATGLFYLGYQVFSGHYKQVLFVPSDIRGVWPMAWSLRASHCEPGQLSMPMRADGTPAKYRSNRSRRSFR